MLVRTTFGDSRASATTSAMTRPITKLMIVSGMVLVIAALASGPRLSQNQLPGRFGTHLRAGVAGPPDALAFRYFCEMVGQRAVGTQFVERLVQVGQQPAVLAGGEALLALLADVPGDLDRLVAGLGEVGVHRDAVVDDDVHPALVEQLDRLGEALDGLDPGTGLAGDLRPVAGRVLGRRPCP